MQHAPPHPAIRPIATAVLQLEPQCAAHADGLFAVLSDPALYAHENAPPPSADWLRRRFAALEARRSPDGRQQWLNWVIRMPQGGLAGTVQATVHPDGQAAIAYMLGRAHWGHGVAHEAVLGMLGELSAHHHVHGLFAVLRRVNLRSQRLLDRLGFTPAPAARADARALANGELLMERAPLGTAPDAA